MNSSFPTTSDALSLLATYSDLRGKYLRFRYSPPMPHRITPKTIGLIVNGQVYFYTSPLATLLEPIMLTNIVTEEIQMDGDTYFLRVCGQVLLDRPCDRELFKLPS